MNRRLQTMLVFMLLGLVILACGTSAGGSSTSDPIIPNITTDTDWWVDQTGTVDSAFIKELDAISDQFEADGYQLAGVIWNDSYSDPGELCTDFGNQNGIGSAEKDNGIAVCVFLDHEGSDGNKPYVFIATGEGLSALTASRVGRFLDKYYVPARAQGEWQQGLKATLIAMDDFLNDPENAEYASITAFPWKTVIIITVFIILWLIFDFGFCKGQLSLAVFEAAAKGKNGTFSGGGTGR